MNDCAMKVCTVYDAGGDLFGCRVCVCERERESVCFSMR